MERIRIKVRRIGGRRLTRGWGLLCHELTNGVKLVHARAGSDRWCGIEQEVGSRRVTTGHTRMQEHPEVRVPRHKGAGRWGLAQS